MTEALAGCPSVLSLCPHHRPTPAEAARQPLALLHLVIDPACTVVFEALPASPGLMHQPPRPPEAPLFGAARWRRALLQGGSFALLALILGCWPGLETVEPRSLVFALLLQVSRGCCPCCWCPWTAKRLECC
jgi:hypothetical protein